MITSHNFSKDFSLFHVLKEISIDQKVVKPFTNVFLSIIMFNSPPSIGSLRWMQLPKSINPPFIQKSLKACPLLSCKTWLLMSVRSDMNINFLKTHVKIATNYDSFALLFQLLAISMKSFLVFLCLVFKSFKLFLTWFLHSRSGHIDYDKIKQLVF